MPAALGPLLHRFVASENRLRKDLFFIMRCKKSDPPKRQKHNSIKGSSFGERLRLARKSCGLSQYKLQKKTGISLRTIGRYEHNISEPSLTELNRIAEALNVSLSYLVGWNAKDDVKPYLLKYFNILQALPPQKRKAILDMIKIAAAKKKCARSI